MKPIIPDPKKPWKVCDKQLNQLKADLLTRCPLLKFSEGIRYALHVECPADATPFWILDLAESYKIPIPDQLFAGTVCGRSCVILMYLPFFD